MEESLGKGGKGIVVFSDQTIVPPRADDNRALPDLRVRMVAGEPGEAERINESVNREDAPSEMTTLYQPLLASSAAQDRLAGVAALFLGLQLSTALYGFLCDIPFAGQPAVEDYKRRARDLRTGQYPIRVALAASTPLVTDRFTLLPPPKTPAPSSGTLDPALAALAALAAPAGGISYLDLTINGELTPEQTAAIDMRVRHLGGVLGAPVKLRRAPASYHSTEQSEMDGPPDLVSLRTLARQSEPCLIGQYDATFLRAQAAGTWLAMNERGRTCVLLLYDGTNDELAPALCALLDRLASAVVSDREGRDASQR